jgi:cytochrome b
MPRYLQGKITGRECPGTAIEVSNVQSGLAMTTIDIGKEAEQVESHQVWDLPVRVFHWMLVIAFIGAFVTNRLGVAYFEYHVWCGYAVLVLVVFRILWGIVGTRHALFRNFVRGPIETARYALALLRGRHPHYPGHNPLGALMVVTLLLALAIQAASGLFGNDEIFNVGPLYGYVSKELSLQLTSLHRQLFWWIAAAAGLHILAVIAHHVFRREKLVQAMITGRKPAYGLDKAVGIHSSRTWLAVVLNIALAVALAWVVNHAPEQLADVSYF